MNLGFYNHASNKPNATEGMTISVRTIYPDAPFVMGCDNSYDYTDLCKKYNCTYYHNYTSIGYAPNPSGYSLEMMMLYFDRMYVAVTTLDTEYFMMLEDDVIILDTIDIVPDVGGMGFIRDPRAEANQLHPQLISMIEDYSGVKPIYDQYNCAGGTIFRSKDFVDNYAKIRAWFGKNTNKVKEFYPTIGFIDCFMFIWYLLAGQTVIENKKLYNIWPIDRNFDLSRVPAGFTIVHNYKNLY